MQKYADVVLDRKGNVVPGATVRVKTSLGANAILYSANGSSPISNPVTTDNLGRFAFYAENGRYNLQVYIGSALFTVSNDILLEDPMDETPETIKGGVIKDSALSNVTIDGKAPAYKDDTDDLDVRVTEIETSTGIGGRWCGVSATPPTTRLNGDPLQAGDDYQNPTDNERYYWTGAEWLASSSRVLEERLAGDAGAEIVKQAGRSVADSLADLCNIKDGRFGTIGDGSYHPVSEWYTVGFAAYRGYADLAAVQVDYPHVVDASDSVDWVAITAADNEAAALGGSTLWVPGKYVTNKTLILKANVLGLGKAGAWATDNRGAILTNYGAGDPKQWTDIDGTDLPNFTPIVVVGRSGVTITGITIRDSGARWSCGLFLPCVRRVAVRDTDVMGQFTQSGIYLDATWSNSNTTLTSQHPTIESDTGMNEFTVTGGFITGLWGIKIQGTTRNVSTLPWVWGTGGTSDTDVISCRLGSEGPVAERQADGGAFYHDAVIPNSAGAGQGINFVNVGFRVAAKYGLKLDHSNRITFINCYGETISSWRTAGNPAAVFAYTSNTGSVSMSNDAVGFGQVKDGVALPAGSLLEWQSGRTINKTRADGFFASPNIFGNASSSIGLLFTSFANLGLTTLRYDDGTSAVPFLHFANTTIRPEVPAAISLGTTGFPFLTGNIHGVRVTTELRPTVDNTVDVGAAAFRFAVVRAGTGTIATSDERCKEDIEAVHEAAMNAWSRVEYVQYKFSDAVAKKGDGSRWHFGVIAQRVQEAFEAEGLDPFAYGLLCHDAWDELPEVRDEDGNVTQEYQAAGDRYGVRYDEAMVLESALVRRELVKIKALLGQ